MRYGAWMLLSLWYWPIVASPLIAAVYNYRGNLWATLYLVFTEWTNATHSVKTSRLRFLMSLKCIRCTVAVDLAVGQ